MATRTHTLSLYYYITLVLVFLLLARTRCEWVEISQNHYRKEPSRQETVNINHEETTEFIIPYKNNSLMEKHWKKGVIDRVSPSTANIRRVHVPSEKTSSNQIEKHIFTIETSVHNNAPDQSYDSVIAKPNVLSKLHEGKKPTKPSEKTSVPYHTYRGSAFEKKSETAHTANTNILSRIESVNKAYITNVKKENLYPDIESLTSIYIKGSQNIGNITTQRTQQIKYQDESKMNFNYEGRTGVINDQYLPKDSKLKDFFNILTPIVQSLPINNPMIEKTVSFVKRTEIDSEAKTSEAKNTHFTKQIQGDKNKENIKYGSNEEAAIINSNATENNKKGSTLKTMWNLMKVVTDSIYKSTRKSFRSKINYLEGLKSNILSSIEDQVERTWPEDNARSHRHVRDTAGRGHVEFPSSESALMSISFLTFAVFLIKLVLQVIHTYKNKTMMVTPALVTAVGRAAAAVKSNY